MISAFQSSAFQNNAFQISIAVPIPVGGHGSEEGDDPYEEPRRVTIAGKPYTVRSKAEYLGLLARGRRDKAREQADQAIQDAQDAAREALRSRKGEDATQETARLLHAVLERQRVIEPFQTDAIPLQLLMLIAADL